MLSFPGLPHWTLIPPAPPPRLHLLLSGDSWATRRAGPRALLVEVLRQLASEPVGSTVSQSRQHVPSQPDQSPAGPEETPQATQALAHWADTPGDTRALARQGVPCWETAEPGPWHARGLHHHDLLARSSLPSPLQTSPLAYSPAQTAHTRSRLSPPGTFRTGPGSGNPGASLIPLPPEQHPRLIKCS